MKPLTAEWVAKAEVDYQGAVALGRRRKIPLPDLVCFHCQQCAEKYLKALLQEAGTAFPKTHVLVDLLNLALGPDPTLAPIQPSLLVLEDYAVKFRYPGLDATVAQARAAMQALRMVRRRIRKRLGI
jgi:HEPN domain-containing protein